MYSSALIITKNVKSERPLAANFHENHGLSGFFVISGKQKSQVHLRSE